MYYFFRLAARIMPRLPTWLLYLLPDIIAPLAWLLAVRVRRQATINALHVLGPDVRRTAAGRRKLRRVVRGMLRSATRNYIEVLAISRWSQQEVLQRTHAEHREYLDEALALGKGVILVSAHFGPFEYLAQWFAANGYQMVIPVEKLKDERMLRLMVDLRSSQGVKFIPLGGSAPLRALFQALRQNQIVLIPADRAVVGESVVRDFFGAPARLPIGPVNLSIRTGAPLVVALGWRTDRHHIGGEFIRLTLALPEDERKQPDILQAALIKELERIISQHPEQWVVLSKVWE